MRSFIKYVKKNGFKHFFEVIYKYKIDILIRKILMIFLKNKPLKNVIVIASHNDFDCNGGAFYDFLIKNHYNEKYKIVWLLRNDKKYNLPSNVKAYYAFRPSIAKNYFICTAKIFTADCNITPKVRNDQKSFFFSHGPIGLKNVKGKFVIPSYIDYILAPAKQYMPIFSEQRNMDINSEKFVHLGYPFFDTLFSEPTGELQKITTEKYSKVILWMPTFRKGGGYQRNDSSKEQPMGIPIIESEDMLYNLNDKLSVMNVLLIIKIHPMQDLSNFKIFSMSNIIVLKANDVRRLEVDNYKLMREVDALISDYSAAAYEFLLLNRPIGYDFSDLAYYNHGLCVENVEDYIAGPIINDYNQFIEFIESVLFESDNFEHKRKELMKKLYDPCDGHCCERIAKFMDL
ncbi:MAG: CDP-glycerol glycerophosphotransferase family protein [Oscillospiraceae bacterium]|nr:CDP-glycerol glycerophosphotransferase family protein [Oscillospiraceae bacterium]